jgi:large subunit ribosomal protein L24
MSVKFKIKKNDTVEIISGKAKGNKGRVIRIDKDKGRIYIEGQNMVKKAMRQKKQNQKGGIVEVEAPIDISNVMIICKKCGKSRIGYKIENDKKMRICKKCGDEL